MKRHVPRDNKPTKHFSQLQRIKSRSRARRELAGRNCTPQQDPNKPLLSTPLLTCLVRLSTASRDISPSIRQASIDSHTYLPPGGFPVVTLLMALSPSNQPPINILGPELYGSKAGL